MLRTCVTALFVIFCLTLIQTVELTGPALSVAAEEKKSGDNSGQEASGKKSASKGTSDAERVVRIKSSLESDRLKKTDLEKQLKDFQKDFDTAAAELNKQADALDEGKEKLENLRKAGKSAEAAKLEEEIKKLEKKYSLAKKRSDLIFAARTNIQQQIKALDETIQRDQQILESMQGTKHCCGTQGSANCCGTQGSANCCGTQGSARGHEAASAGHACRSCCRKRGG
jgi:hypothetical protein